MSITLRSKSIFDRILVLPLIAISLPLFAVIVIAITIDALLNNEPLRVIYSEKRLSAMRAFSILRFRAIRSNTLEHFLINEPESSVRAIEKKNANLTKVGRILKILNLVDLPQLFNVLRGDMCIVGPRPYSLKEWSEDARVRIPARKALKAGFIGPYQSSKGAAIGGTAANLADTQYFVFSNSATLPCILLNDFYIILMSLLTLVRVYIKTYVSRKI